MVAYSKRTFDVNYLKNIDYLFFKLKTAFDVYLSNVDAKVIKF